MTDSTTTESALDSAADAESLHPSDANVEADSLLHTAKVLSHELAARVDRLDKQPLESLTPLVNLLQQSQILIDKMTSALASDEPHPAMASVVNTDKHINQLIQSELTASTAPTDSTHAYHTASQGHDAVVEAIKKMSTLFQ